MLDPAPPNRGVMIVLAYLWPLALVPLLFDKRDNEVRWHARHGIVIMIAEIAALSAYIAITSVVSLAAFGIGVVLSLLLVFAWIGVLALHATAMIKGLNGGRLIIPGISQYADRF